MTPELLLIVLVVWFAAMMQSMTGFGFGLILVGMVSFISPIKSAVLLNVLPALTVNCVLTWRLRSHFQWEHLRGLALVALCVTPVGVLLVAYLDAQVMNGLLALVLLVTLLQAVWLRGSKRPWHPLWLGVPMGTFAGLLAGAFGIGGPPLVAYVQSYHYDRFRHVVSLQVLLAMAGVFRVLSLIYHQSLTGRQWGINALAAVIVLPGLWVGLKLLRIIPQVWLRRLILLLLAVMFVHAMNRAIG